MSKIRPFRALRPSPERAAEIAAVPYDVVSTAEARALALGNPLSFLHVSRAEIDLPEGTDPYSESVYRRARENLERLTDQAPLLTEAEPSLYLYRLEKDGRSQTGIAATYAIDEYESGAIARHERTRQDKEDDRTRHLLAIGAQTGPAFLIFRDRAEIAREIGRGTSGPPLFSFVAPDGVRHELWKISRTEEVIEAFRGVPRLYIADGHHRAASAARARRELGRQGKGAPEAEFMLAVAFPASELRILPYHRLLRDLNGRRPEEILAALSRGMNVRPDAAASPSRGSFSLFVDGRWYGLEPRVRPMGAIESLDVSVLQTQVLEPVFGIGDPRTDPRIDFVGGVHGTGELERRVRSGQAACAFSLHATSIEDLLTVADAGEVMPPKSTWFEPKLRDGLLSVRIER